MKKKKDKTSEEIPTVGESNESELEMPIWSVITFDECAASGLTYDKAAKKLGKLKSEKVAGLCIVTDATAARIKKAKKKK